jgi:hypothetical protein
MKKLSNLFCIIALVMLNLGCQSTAKEQQHESWMFIWSVAELNGQDVILITEVKKVDQQNIGDQELAEKFKEYYKSKNISNISEPVIVSSDTKEEAEKDRDFRIQDYTWDEELSLADEFAFTP